MDRTKEHARTRDEHDEQPGCEAPRGLFTMHMWTVRQEGFLQPEADHAKVKPSSPLPDLPNQPRDCYQIIGEDEAALGDPIPTNL
jgi:hypothetical protein